MKNLNDTIVALSTVPLQSALAIIRISGKNAFAVIQKIFSKKVTIETKNAIIHGYIVDGEQKIDDVLLFVYKSPSSFTGENMVEISCHGSLIIINKIISLIIANGARMADKGEFSQRAFYNNKIDLLQAESINDLIMAKTNASSQVALFGVEGVMSGEITLLKKEILDVLAHIEVNIDYPEYDDVEELTSHSLKPLIEKINKRVSEIIADADVGQVIKNGVNVAIIGRPNVGKSSILNALIHEDKAIVSEIEGTTRDVVEGTTTMNGILFNFLDTAGIRNDADYLEEIGIKKTKEVIRKADLILLISDSKGMLNEEEKELEKLLKDKKYIVVFNKSDLTHLIDETKIVVSTKNNDIQPLVDAMVRLVGFAIDDYQNKPLLSNARQKGLMENVKNNLEDALLLCD